MTALLDAWIDAVDPPADDAAVAALAAMMTTADRGWVAVRLLHGPPSEATLLIRLLGAHADPAPLLKLAGVHRWTEDPRCRGPQTDEVMGRWGVERDRPMEDALAHIAAEPMLQGLADDIDDIDLRRAARTVLGPHSARWAEPLREWADGGDLRHVAAAIDVAAPDLRRDLIERARQRGDEGIDAWLSRVGLVAEAEATHG